MSDLARDRDSWRVLAELANTSRNSYQARLVYALNALREIADADPVDMALDPGWARRVAREVLDATREAV